MYLQSLTIQGFKSFAKKSELSFSAQVTGIVGPNGSGKSNVAEAFRFVLGEQSVKSLRGKKGEDLIFSGTNQEKRQNRASVCVMLDNTKRTFALDFDEVKIERVVHRDGANEYFLNDSKVRLKDIQELLAAAHIGPTGHHIISQGEADRVLSAPPKERRAMIEDALGLKIYQYKKAESERKLQKTRENLQQVSLLRKEAAPHLAYLERQIKKIEKSLALQEELKGVYAEYLRREDVYIAWHHDRLTAALSAPQAKVAELKQTIADLKTALASEQKNDERDAVMALEEALSAHRAKQQAVERQAGQLEGQIEYLKRRIERAQSTVGQVAPVPFAKLEDVVGKAVAAADKALSKQDPNGIERALSDIVHTLNKFIRDVSESSAPTTEAEEKELSTLENQQDQIEAERAKLQILGTELEEKITAAKAAADAVVTDNREAERALFTALNEQREAENEVNRITRELELLERDRRDFKEELQEAVSLLGRAASLYYEHQIMVDGQLLTPDAIATEDREQQRMRRRELEKMKIRLEELGIGATEDIEQEYKEAKARDEFLAKETADLEASAKKLDELIVELNNELNEQFMSGIERIEVEFKKFFTLMFGGGDAKLTTVTPKPKTDEDGEVIEEENLEPGIELDVQLPNKRVRGLDMLSGGERALTSIALIFAMSQVNPPPFIILDETDAALDEANSRRYGDMIEALAEKSQLILITHNRETMSRAGILYGVTMGADGISKLLSVKFDEAVEVAK